MTFIVNEVFEVQQFLDGKNVNPDNLQRICFMLARWYKEQGYDHLQIREAIFNWANQYHYYLDFSVNSVIYRVMADKTRLKDNVNVMISEDDVIQIKSRFDSKNTRLIALAILCYAKAFADRDGQFDISETALANWVDIRRTNLSSYYMKELLDFGYIEKVKSKKATYTWNKKVRSKNLRLKIKVPIKGDGVYQLIDNDIIRLYNEIFG